MTKTDKYDRPYANPADIHLGTLIEVDDGFTCLKPWTKHTVKIDNDGRGGEYIECSEGKHFLGGQLNAKQDALIGIYVVEE